MLGNYGLLPPAFLGASRCRSPRRSLASKHKAAQLSPGWAEHRGAASLQGGRAGAREEKGLCGLPSSERSSRIPQMERLRIWALEAGPSPNPSSAPSLTRPHV